MKRIALGLSAFLLFTSCILKKPVTLNPAKELSPSSFKALPAKKTSSSTAFQEEFLERINRLRAKGCTCNGEYMPPAPPLTWSSQLELAALGHAQDMNRNKYFDHLSKNGQTLKDRIFSTGYTYDGYKSFFIGENIALGQRSIKEVMNDWISSYGHCKNLMNPQFKEVGIAVVNSYWVQDFGARNPFDGKRSRK